QVQLADVLELGGRRGDRSPFFEGKKAEETSSRKSTPRTLKEVDQQYPPVILVLPSQRPHACGRHHRMTSSAWKRSVGGSVRSRARAALMLITNSNLVGRSTGRAAGVAPFKRRST